MDILLSDRPAIFVTGHCGNFEMLGFTLAVVGFPLTAVARPLDFPRVNDWLLDVRGRRGMTILDKAGASERIPEILENAGRIAFIADQDAGRRGVFVPFFNHLASSYKTIALMAMRYEVPIVCGMARRRVPNRFQYEIVVQDIVKPSDWEAQPDPTFYITARYTKAIEDMVRESPEQYFWVHRRWKSRPRHEREGAAFPDSLRRKISHMPWLSESGLSRIITNSDRQAAIIRAENTSL
jgi:KDO2-lipid IV(A) lauroyltransferase